MPIVNTMPAMPGSVSVAPSSAIEAKMNRICTPSARSAKTPKMP